MYNMKGIILAAGRGSRMGQLTETQPKCRTVLHGKSLIEWQLDALHQADIREISIVCGYLAKTFDFDVQYFHNPRWAETNMVMSLVAADQWLATDTCVVSYSDIVYSADAVERLKSADGDIVMTYDPNWRTLWERRFVDPLSDAETFRLEGNRVLEIGNRAASLDQIEGQYMGLLRFTPKGWQAVSGFLSARTPEQRDRMDMTLLLQGLIAEGVEINAVAISDAWYEVDNENDLKLYSTDLFYFNSK